VGFWSAHGFLLLVCCESIKAYPRQTGTRKNNTENKICLSKNTSFENPNISLLMNYSILLDTLGGRVKLIFMD
jgi:hypothetical protein